MIVMGFRGGRPSWTLTRATLRDDPLSYKSVDDMRLAFLGKAVFRAAEGLERFTIRDLGIPNYEMRTPGWVPTPEVQVAARASMPDGCRLEFSADLDGGWGDRDGR